VHESLSIAALLEGQCGMKERRVEVVVEETVDLRLMGRILNLWQDHLVTIVYQVELRDAAIAPCSRRLGVSVSRKPIKRAGLLRNGWIQFPRSTVQGFHIKLSLSLGGFT
jgi:hypothetical protein